MSESRRVDLVIPTHNRREITLTCLRSLSRITKEGLAVNIIVVDDGSTDGTRESIACEFPDVRVIEGDGTLFYTGAVNLGMRISLEDSPDFVVILNDDSVFDQDFLTNLVETATSHPRTIVGALLLLWDEPHRVFQVSPRWETLSGGYRHWRKQTVWTVPQRPWQVELIVGNCVLFPSAALRECGLMDGRLFPHYGDAEITPRMRRMGWRLLLDPRSRVFCQPNDMAPRLRAQSFRKILHTLFINPHSGHSMKRRWNACVYGGPGKIIGAAAFAVSLFRWLVGISLEGPYGETLEEAPLSETFKEKMV